MIDKMKNLIQDKEKIRHYFIYFVFGVLTTLVSFFSLLIIRKLAPSLNRNIANIISIFLAILFAYFTNRKFVFKSKETNIIKEFYKFFLSRISSLLFETFFFWLLTTLLPDNTFYEMLSKLICSFFVMIINYVLSRFLVFKEEKRENKTSER